MPSSRREGGEWRERYPSAERGRRWERDGDTRGEERMDRRGSGRNQEWDARDEQWRRPPDRGNASKSDDHRRGAVWRAVRRDDDESEHRGGKDAGGVTLRAREDVVTRTRGDADQWVRDHRSRTGTEKSGDRGTERERYRGIQTSPREIQRAHGRKRRTRRTLEDAAWPNAAWPG